MSEEVVPIPQPLSLLERLEREMTDAVMDRVRRFARKRALVKRCAGVPGYDDLKAEALDMANEAVTLTVLGQRAWDPEVDLYDHLCGVVRSESTKECAKHIKFRHQSIQALALDESYGGDADVQAQITRGGPDIYGRPRHQASVADARRQVIEALRVLARGDDLVGDILDAREAGYTTKQEIVEVTGMTDNQYRAAAKRFNRMLDRLPDNLGEGAQDALEISYGY
jgi:hypothetical protein